jgi:hypothetical protein
MRRQGLFHTAGLAGGGMLLAHWLAYVLAFGDPHARAHILAQSGHSYWIYAAAVGLAAATLGFGSLVRNLNPHKRGISLGTRLAMFQVAGFVALEAAERLATGHALVEVFTEPGLWIGIVVQVALALLGASLVRGVAQLVARLTAPRFQRTRITKVRAVWFDVPNLFDPDEGPLSRRGPPVLA